MLKEPVFQVPDAGMAMIRHILSGGRKTEKIRDGVWRCFHFNFGHEIEGNVNEYSDDKLGKVGLPSFGVCDSEGQFLEKFAPRLESLDENFCVSLTTILKSDQPKQGGWRWHKWGPYIGVKNPRREYLCDEDDNITQVCIFHIYEIE